MDGHSKANKYLVIYIQKESAQIRIVLGISVSKKVGNSIVRHRLTRLIRESYRLNEEKVARGYDMVVIARSAAKGKNYHDIESAFLHLGKSSWNNRVVMEWHTFEKDFDKNGSVLSEIFIFGQGIFKL